MVDFYGGFRSVIRRLGDLKKVRLIQMGDSMNKFKPETDALTAASFNEFIKVTLS